MLIVKGERNMKKRSIGMMILFTIITCGIYLIYWYVVFQVALKEKTGDGYGAGMHMVASLFTFGIYYIYWQYAAGKRLQKAGCKSDNSILYLIFPFVGLGWINPYIMQSQMNEIAK